MSVDTNKLNETEIICPSELSFDEQEYYNDSNEKNTIMIQDKAVKSEKRRVTYDDIYLGNEMLITRSKSLPKESEKNNKYLNK